MKGASTSAVPGKEEEQYLHEALFGWEGWSLAAKRPGQAITNTKTAPPTAEDTNENPYDVPLVTHFEAAPRIAAPAPVRPHLSLPRARGRPRRQLGARGSDRPRPRDAVAHVVALGSGAVACSRPAPAVHRGRVVDADGDPLDARRAPERLRATRPHHRARRPHRRRPRVSRDQRPPRRAAARIAAARRVAREVRRRDRRFAPIREPERAVRHREAASPVPSCRRARTSSS